MSPYKLNVFVPRTDPRKKQLQLQYE